MFNDLSQSNKSGYEMIDQFEPKSQVTKLAYFFNFLRWSFWHNWKTCSIWFIPYFYLLQMSFFDLLISFLFHLHRRKQHTTWNSSSGGGEKWGYRIAYSVANSNHSRYVSWMVEYNICHVYLINEGIAKTCKKFDSHDGFLRADQDRAKNCCQIGWIGCPIWQVDQKATVRFQFPAYFCNPLIK